MKELKKFIKTKKIRKIAKEAIKEENIKEYIIEILKEHPEIRKELLNEISLSIDSNDEVSNTVLDEVAIGIARSKEIPDSVLDENMSDQMTDEGIENLILNGKMSLERQVLMLNKINDKEIFFKSKKIIDERKLKLKIDKEKNSKYEALKKIEEIFSKVEKMPEHELIDEIQAIKLEDERIKAMKMEVVAKKIAYNYLKYGTTMTNYLSKIMSIDEMFAGDIQSIVEKYWEEIPLRERKKALDKGYEYKKIELRNLLLNQIAKETVRLFEENGRFIIPQSSEMHKLSGEGKKYFIKQIESYLGKRLNKMQLKDINAQINGIIGINKGIEELEEKIADLTKEELEKYLSISKAILNDKKSIDTIARLQKQNVINLLNKMNEENKNNAIEVYSESLRKREKQIKEEKYR